MPTECPSQLVECAICHRITDENHAETFDDFWVCLWCSP